MRVIRVSATAMIAGAVLAAPAVAQRVPAEAVEALLAHVHQDQGATALVLDRESLERSLGMDLHATEVLLERLSGRGIPARWCDEPCSSAPSEREVSVEQVLISEPDLVQLELVLFGRHAPSPDGGGITAWLERRALQLRHDGDRWAVTADESIYVGDYGSHPRGDP